MKKKSFEQKKRDALRRHKQRKDAQKRFATDNNIPLNEVIKYWDKT